MRNLVPKMHVFPWKWVFDSLSDEKIFITPRGGPVRLFRLPRGFTSRKGLSPQKKIFVIAHPLHWKNRTSKSRKIDFFEKNFEKILKVQKFRWSRSGRNFCWQGRTSQAHNLLCFQSWNISSKTRKVMIIRSCAAFVQNMHLWTAWLLVNLNIS